MPMNTPTTTIRKSSPTANQFWSRTCLMTLRRIKGHSQQEQHRLPGSPLPTGSSDPAEQQVEYARGRIVGLRLEVNYQFAALVLGHRLQKPIHVIERIAGEVHLRSQLVEASARNLEVDVRRSTPAVHYRIGARLDGLDTVTAFGISLQLRPALEVFVQRRRVGVGFVRITTVRIGLPDVDQRVGYRVAVLVKHAPVDFDHLT